jgi:hypothetical protein
MGSGGIAPPLLTSALDGDEWSTLRPGRFTPGEIAASTRWIGRWVGPRAGLHAVENSESNPGRAARSLLLYRLSYPDSSLSSLGIR